MVRKQLYITAAQNDALKRRARQLGVSEAELARKALDGLLREHREATAPRAATKSARERALDELLATAQSVAAEHRFREGYRFNRNALYEDRLARQASAGSDSTPGDSAPDSPE